MNNYQLFVIHYPFIKNNGSHCHHASHTLQSEAQIMAINDGLTIPDSLYQIMLQHLQAEFPLEGCGLMAGNDGLVTAVYPIDNILKSPIAYEMNPKQQARRMLEIEANGELLLAIYHSHPSGPNRPSATDIALAYYPDSIYIIISFAKKEEPDVRGYRIVDALVSEIQVSIV